MVVKGPKPKVTWQSCNVPVEFQCVAILNCARLLPELLSTARFTRIFFLRIFSKQVGFDNKMIATAPSEYHIFAQTSVRPFRSVLRANW